MVKKTFAELQAELEDIIDWFESGNSDIDQAAVRYEQGLKLAAELKARLKETENKVTKLKQRFDES